MSIMDKIQQPMPGTGGKRAHDASTESLEEMPIKITLDQIKEYDRNPRRSDNSEYEAIRSSIKERGMEATLNITKRPGEEHYMPYNGGNTRIRASKSLYAETGDEKYNRLNCIYKPWPGEEEVLIAHLVENDVRGDYTFLDRAQGIQDLKNELGLDDLSQRQLATVLSERGYKIGHQHISRLTYALDVLYPAIPLALEAGLGKPAVVKLRKLDSAGAKVWAYNHHNPEDWPPVWQAILSKFDDPNWNGNTNPIRRAVENEIADGEPDKFNMVSIEMGVVLEGGSLSEKKVFEDPVTSDAPEKTPQDHNTNTADNEEPLPLAARASTPGTPDENHTSGQGSTTTTEGHPDPTHTPATTPPQPAKKDLKSLRSRAWVLAERLTQRARMGDVVMPIKGGLGYVVIGFPDLSGLDKEQTMMTKFLWWEITACCDVVLSDQVGIILPEDNIIRRVFGFGDEELILPLATNYPAYIGSECWTLLDDQAWSDMRDLREVYREMKQGHCLAQWDLYPREMVL